MSDQTGCPPSNCPTCQGSQLYHGEIVANGEVLFIAGTFRNVPVRCSVCLSCGTLFPYVDDDAIQKLRAWKAKG